MSRSRTPAMLLFALALVGVGSLAVARVRTAEQRTLPYQGALERDGVRVTGDVAVRFGLFGGAGEDTACVVTNDCALWSEEQVITVVDGTFSVLLGEGGGRPLTSAVLDSPELFLAVAVKAEDDTGFTALSGLDEIVAAPLLQPGAVAASSFATDRFFSAELVFSGGVYVPTKVFPANWIPANPRQQGQVARVLVAQTFAVSGYTCTASALGGPRRFPIVSASTAQIDVATIGSGGTSPGSFTLMCHGF